MSGLHVAAGVLLGLFVARARIDEPGWMVLLPVSIILLAMAMLVESRGRK